MLADYGFAWVVEAVAAFLFADSKVDKELVQG